AAAVWVKEDLFRIESHPAGRIERPLDSIPIKLPRLHVRHEHVPVMVGTIGCRVDRNDPRGLGIVFPVKQQQLYGGCPAREYAEIDAARLDRGSQRIAAPCALSTVCRG